MDYNKKVVRKYYKVKDSADLPQDVVNGQVLYAEDENALYLDNELTRDRLNPPADWNEINESSPSFIANKPELGTVAELGAAKNFKDNNAIPTVGQINEALYNVTHWIKFKEPKVYGVNFLGINWSYTISSRIDDASGFTDPIPAISVSGKGGSPFDNIYPWRDMKVVNILPDGTILEMDDMGFSMTDNDTMVWIPEFYYRATKKESSSTWVWEISDSEKEGFKKHPGSGRYVGRYHTSGSSSGVYSKSNVLPLVDTNQADFRIYSHNKGPNWYMMDIATWSAIQMLYLVEYANFDSQTMLGKGWNTGVIGSTGGTNNAVYHTVKTTGMHNQYRWIEDPFSNVSDWIDGYVGSQSEVYIGLNNEDFEGGTSGLTKTSLILPNTSNEKYCITDFGYDENYDFAFIPDDGLLISDYNQSAYDSISSSTSLYPAIVGGTYEDSTENGFFSLNGSQSSSDSFQYLGSRLIYIP